MATSKRNNKNEDKVIDVEEETSEVTDAGMVSIFKHMNSGNDRTYLAVIEAMKEEKDTNNGMLQMIMNR